MGINILVIDDEKNIRLMLSKCLLSEGYEVDIAEDGIQGIEMFGTKGYNIVLLDMKMPGLSGMDVLKKLKESDNPIPVIMMTAFGTIESAVEAMKLGAVDYIRKPFTPDIIRSEINSVLERMKLSAEDAEDFVSCLQYAKKCIILKDYNKAREYLMKSISKGTDNPEPFNLLGVLDEFDRDLQGAQKYYRMALSVDASYEPAIKNLERTAQFKYTFKGINLGNMNTEEDTAKNKEN